MMQQSKGYLYDDENEKIATQRDSLSRYFQRLISRNLATDSPCIYSCIELSFLVDSSQ